MQPGHRPWRRSTTKKVGTHAPQEEGLRLHQAADPGRSGHARPARRPGPRSARRQHHGVRQGVQRRDGGPARQRHPGRDHGLRGPLVHLRHEDPAGRRADQEGRWRRQGLRRAAQDQGRQALARPGPRDRPSEDGRPQRQRRGDGEHASSPAPLARWASTPSSEPSSRLDVTRPHGIRTVCRRPRGRTSAGPHHDSTTTQGAVP